VPDGAAPGAGHRGTRLGLSTPAPNVALLSLFNPPGGLMDDASVLELEAALDRVEADDTVRAVVITGEQPGVFVRHFDVGILEANSRAMAARGLSFETSRPVPETRLHRCLRRIEHSRKPYVAAINGIAMGGGYELALACDLRIAEAGDYPIGLPEVNIGLLPGAGGTQRLSRLIGAARALELILLGRTVVPREAAVLGLVNECCEAPVLERALQVASRLAAQPRLALGHAKRLVRQSSQGDAERGLADERTLFCDLMVDAESIELMRQFNQGERPIT